MIKKLQVFISSTYTDLIEERQTAVEAILNAGHIPAGMELFRAGKSQMETIKRWIDESDVYLLILGGRYGSVDEESDLSYTQLEYEYALSKKMPVFAIVLSDSFLFIKAAQKGKEIIFENNDIRKYDSFKKTVKSKIVKFVNNHEEISTVIHSHLNSIINDADYHLTGWIRADSDSFSDNECLCQIEHLMQMREFSLKVPGRNRLKPVEYRENAKSYFISQYNLFCSGFRKNLEVDFVNTVIYNQVVPFYVGLDVLTEEINDPYSNINRASLTKLGYDLYAKLLS